MGKQGFQLVDLDSPLGVGEDDFVDMPFVKDLPTGTTGGTRRASVGANRNGQELPTPL